MHIVQTVILLMIWKNETPSYPDVKVSSVIPRPDTEGVVSSRVDTGGLDLEDIRGHRAFRGDAHVAMHDGERQVTAFWFHRWTHTST